MTYQSEWTYAITTMHNPIGGNPVVAELPFFNVNFQSLLNGFGTFRGDLLLSGIDTYSLGYSIRQITTPGYYGLYVLNQGKPVWGGVIWQSDWDSETQILSVTAQETLSYYQHRVIDTSLNSAFGGSAIVYNNTYVVDVVSSLLTYANGCTPNGDIGVTYSGPVGTGPTITRTYFNFELKSIYQAWKDLSTGAIGGSGTSTVSLFDFIIKPSYSGGYITNYLTVGQPTIGQTYDPTSSASVDFNFPGNITSYRYTANGATMANMLYGLGYGANANKIIAKVEAGNLLQNIAIFPGSFPLLQSTASYIDVQDYSTLSKITSGKVSAIAIPPTTIEITIPTYIDIPYNQNTSSSSGHPTYNLGDEVRLTIQDDYYIDNLQGIYRIIAIEVTPGENGPDKVVLTLNLPPQSNVV